MNDQNDEPNNNKHTIANQTFKDVPLVIDLSRVDHVENLHHNKNGEYNGEVTTRSIVESIHLIELIAIDCVRSAWVHHTVEVGNVTFSLWDVELSPEHYTKDDNALE